ncbi:MAG: hypothetical protein J6S85_02595 [Methanobrevibacter sp.]|nr:hypothetical protein [Methanobrevibacter sp.]
MAKIFEGIEGYTEMTAEQKLAALEALETSNPNEEIERYKKAASKANSEAADYKRKYTEKLTEAEKAEAAKDEELNALRAKVAESEREKTISGYMAKFAALGYDETLASETAKQFADGNSDAVFASFNSFLQTHDKNYKDSLLRNGSEPPAGKSPEVKTFTRAELENMSADEINANWDAVKSTLNQN